MKRFSIVLYSRLIIAVAVMGILLSLVAQAHSSGGYELTWTTIDAGGGTMSGGGYDLICSIGQPEPGATQSGGNYTLNGGVIDAGKSGQITSGEQRLYVPLIFR